MELNDTNWFHCVIHDRHRQQRAVLYVQAADRDSAAPAAKEKYLERFGCEDDGYTALALSHLPPEDVRPRPPRVDVNEIVVLGGAK